MTGFCSNPGKVAGFRGTYYGLGPGGYSYTTYPETDCFTAAASFGMPDGSYAQFGVCV